MDHRTACQVLFNAGANTRTQFLFDACQLGAGGPVSGISLRLANPSAVSDYANATIVLGHTTNTTLSLTFADNMTDPTTVFPVPSASCQGSTLVIG